MKTSPFKPLQQVMQTRLDEAARELGSLLAREQQSQQRLILLQDYRAEYEARFREALNEGIGVEALRNYQIFMGRIDEAIEAQQSELTRSAQGSAAGRQAWLQHRNRGIAIDTLQSRHESSELRRDARAEQTSSDERSSRKAWEKNTDSD